MYSQRGKKYIYSVERANELIQLGYRCIETGFNAKGQKFFWVFKYEDIDDCFIYFIRKTHYTKRQRLISFIKRVLIIFIIII